MTGDIKIKTTFAASQDPSLTESQLPVRTAQRVHVASHEKREPAPEGQSRSALTVPKRIIEAEAPLTLPAPSTHFSLSNVFTVSGVIGLGQLSKATQSSLANVLCTALESTPSVTPQAGRYSGVVSELLLQPAFHTVRHLNELLTLAAYMVPRGAPVALSLPSVALSAESQDMLSLLPISALAHGLATKRAIISSKQLSWWLLLERQSKDYHACQGSTEWTTRGF